MRTVDTSAIMFYILLVGAIARVFDVAEPASPKPGHGGLKLLDDVSNVITKEGIVLSVGGSASAAERYFDARNYCQRGREVLRRVEPPRHGRRRVALRGGRRASEISGSVVGGRGESNSNTKGTIVGGEYVMVSCRRYLPAAGPTETYLSDGRQ